MPTIIPNRYQTDLTGVNPNNLVIGESHTPAIKKIRSIAPTYGAFFTNSLKIHDVSNNSLLKKDIDYVCVDVISLPTAQSGLEICSIILLLNKLVVTVKIDYQALGGQYERQYTAVRILLENLLQDDRPVDWSNVIKLDDYAPSMHLHALGDVIGFEYVVAALEQIKKVLFLGDEATHAQLLLQISNCNTMLRNLINNPLSEMIGRLEATLAGVSQTVEDVDAKCDIILSRSAKILKEREIINILQCTEPLTQSCTITPNSYNVHEGSVLSFVVDTVNVPDGTVLNWSIVTSNAI